MLFPNPIPQIQFGGFRVTGVDEKGSVTSRRAKFVTFSSIGPSVGVMQKARVGSMSSQMADALHGAHITFQIETPDEMSEAEVESKLLAVGGAHKPGTFVLCVSLYTHFCFLTKFFFAHNI